MSRTLLFCVFLFVSVNAFTYTKKWDGGELVIGENLDDTTEHAFRKIQAYDSCEDIVRDQNIKFNGSNTLRVKMERGKWYGDNTDKKCGGSAMTRTARSETYTR